MKLNIFRSTTKDGIMTKDKKYFPNLNEEERTLLYEANLEKFFKPKNINYKEVVFLTDKCTKMSARTITKTTKVVKEAILILKDKTPNLTVAVETSDSPVIVATVTKDEKITCAIALATIDNLNNDILHEMVECLIKETDAAPFEMSFYVSPCPSKENYILENIDNLTNSYVWNNTYEKKKKNKYLLDLRYAIFNQLRLEIVDPNYIYFDSTDTATTNEFFSDINGNPGKNLVCIVYTED